MISSCHKDTEIAQHSREKGVILLSVIEIKVSLSFRNFAVTPERDGVRLALFCPLIKEIQETIIRHYV